MNKTVLGFALLIFVSCASQPTKAPPDLELRLISTTRTADGFVARFELTNHSGRPFVYRGYSLDRPDPYNTTEIRSSSGWVSHSIAGCGTGLVPQVLPPGSSVTVTLPMHNRDATGIHRRVRATITEIDLAYVVRSEPFNAP